jgi:hypothetical protein
MDKQLWKSIAVFDCFGEKGFFVEHPHLPSLLIQ